MRVQRLELTDPGEFRRGKRDDPRMWAEVGAILSAVRERGDQALTQLVRDLDSPQAGELIVSASELKAALDGLDAEVRAGLEVAIANVRAVAEADLRSRTTVQVSLPPGQTVSLRELATRRAGIYAPGGRAAYPSSVVMCAIPAQVAKVEQLAVASPPGEDGRPHSVVLAACALCGIDEVYSMGGAQAIAALAFGTETVTPVDVIVGPGNEWVTEAKRQVHGQVGIDSLAGPSELVVIADKSADPREIALDVCAQAEHGEECPVIVLSDSDQLLDRVADEVAAVAARSPSVKDAVLTLAPVADTDQAIETANAIAPEHLQLMTADAESLASRATAAGCVFVGAASGTAFGDYVAGSNHVLPTGGAARFSGPLGVNTFLRTQALVSLPVAAARALAPHVGSVARAEGFPVHAESAEVRALDSDSQ